MQWRFPFFRREVPIAENAREFCVPEGQRVYAIGDVHGRFDLLVRLIERIKSDGRDRGPADIQVVMLGDLVDRGPESAHVLEYLRAQQGGFATFHCIAGNHEEAMLASIGDDALPEETGWLTYGGRETMLSYGAEDSLFSAKGAELAARMRKHIPETHIAFLNSLPDRVMIGDYLFVHAGIRPGVPIDQQTSADLRWIRDPFLTGDRDHGMMVVHGHTIRQGPEIRHNRIGIDTGAYNSGILTALALEGNDRWFLAEGSRDS